MVDLPAGFLLFARKINGKISGNTGIYSQIGTNKIIKSTKDPSKEMCEDKFYRLIKGDLDQQYEILISDEDCPWPYASLEDLDLMASLTPDYFGVENINGKRFLILEDVTFQYKYPAFMVIKMGHDSSDRETEENAVQVHKLGFELAGWKIFGKDGTDQMPTNDDKVSDAVKRFFHSGRKHSAREIAQDFLKKLLKIKVFFERQTSFHFRGSSLILLYEADLTRPVDCRVYMLGFSQVLPGYSEKDEAYLLGLNNVVHLFESFPDL